MTFDAITMSPVESVSNHIKHRAMVNAKNNTSRSLQLIIESIEGHLLDIRQKNQRELQMTVIGTKLENVSLPDYNAEYGGDMNYCDYVARSLESSFDELLPSIKETEEMLQGIAG